MKHLFVLMISLLLSACASAPKVERPDYLFKDASFFPPTERINAADVFAISDEMKQYVQVTIAEQLRAKGIQQGLIEALYSRNQLKVDYDSTRTRNAAQTFAERAGNCLSLVVMTAALAKELGLPVHFQSVMVEESWSRVSDMYVAAGHVNLTIGRRFHDMNSRVDDNSLITIDFNPPADNRTRQNFPITEQTILAMYMNNRAAETLARGHVDDAYWWAREAVRQDPDFLSAYNTLGVIYRRHGNPSEAEQALTYLMARDPSNIQAMSNLARVYTDQGRHAEAKTLTATLEQRQPYPPFYFFDKGQAAMRAGDFKTAKDMFAREVQRDAYNHEFQFWLASAYYRLGDFARARKHLSVAMDFSPTKNQQNLYSAKLDRIKAYQ